MILERLFCVKDSMMTEFGCYTHILRLIQKNIKTGVNSIKVKVP